MKTENITVQSIPVLPEIVDHVIRMALDDDVSLAKLAGLIEKEQALTARILALANSSYYKRSRNVYTVRDAVVVIGMDSVRTMALGLSVLDMFPSKKGSCLNHKDFWRHSMACAIYAKSMMESISNSLSAKAFCAGLLHDIGKLVLDRTRPKEYARVLKEAKDGSRPLVEIEKEILGITHTDVGRGVLSHWKLPKIYEECIWCHHSPVKVLDDEQYKVSGIVHIANILSHMTYIGSSGNNFPLKITNPLLKRFGLNPDLLDELMVSVPKEIDSICEEIGIGSTPEGLFRLVNKANMRLAETSMMLQQRTRETALSRKRSDILIRLLSELNGSTKISEALGKASGLLTEAGLIKGFLGGLKIGRSSLVYESGQGDSSRFIKVGDEEIKSMILSGDYSVGMNMASGIVVYLDLIDKDFIEDQVFVSSIIGAIAASLRRIYAETAMVDEKGVLRQALKSASEEKQKAEEMLYLNRELIDASSVGLCLLDEKNIVRLENEKSRDIKSLLGISSDDFIKSLGSKPVDAKKDLKDAITSRLETDILWRYQENSIRFITRPVKLNNWMLLIIWDVTKDIEDQRRTYAFERMSTVGNLAASMAHNMKSPLGAIQGFGNIIKDDLNNSRIRILRGEEEDLDFKEMINNIIVASENVLKIVNQLLNLTKKWDSPEGEVEMEDFVDGIFHLLSSQANSAGVSLNREIECRQARFKRQAMEQILINLLINAIKASKKDSEVVMRVSIGDDGVIFSIIDHGIGMDKEQIKKIFEPLYTAWPLKTGMGLGLSLAKDMVDSMGGEINVSSKSGEGSTFRVWIPLKSGKE